MLAPQHFNYAALAIGFAIPFDALDGRIARMTNTTSEFGKELDSLADVITFGVAPSILAFSWGFRSLALEGYSDIRQRLVQLGAFICFLFLICGSARLARFNISHNPVALNPGRGDRKYFVGMPIPASAGMIAAVVHFFRGEPLAVWWMSVLWMGLVGLIGFLMVSTWRFWSGKEINLFNRHPFRLLILLGAFVYALVVFSQVLLLLMAAFYTCSGIFSRAAYSWSRGRKPANAA
ncbi:CDP-diacylglycerol--serine O-phosphatidyltransferase [Acidisarcina polymorpha]|uniref:CDP-diacylglycerol--serine O-phosphatidyltransferase n=1 Tax=Acidisarcina polymorpha TaxID=2211140 RepID=A0A2Z5G7N8_9BACT|nr:CDP-diacylglycerol--serine O-phosphatidyltransferase [Acidisarcina polymorpha]